MTLIYFDWNLVCIPLTDDRLIQVKVKPMLHSYSHVYIFYNIDLQVN